MAAFVLDCSVVMAWCFEETGTAAYATSVLQSLSTHGAIVPSIWPYEVVNVLAVAERRKRITALDADRFLDLIQSLPIHLEEVPIHRLFGKVFDSARAYGLSAYDAAYLDLARREGAPLATLDKELRRAARRAKVTLL